MNFLLSIIEDTKQFKLLEKDLNTDQACYMFEMICTSFTNIPFQSLAMQIGLQRGHEGKKAFATGARIIKQFKDIGLYELVIRPKTAFIRPKLQFTEAEMHFIHRKKKEQHEQSRRITDNHGLLLGKYSYHEKDQNMDFINKINKVPFKLDMDIVGNFAGENMPLNTDEMLAEYYGSNIYFRWGYDKRGRSYSEGYGINIQGNKTTRAYLEFANQEVINNEETLYIALANAAGLDKSSWRERILWACVQDLSIDNIVIPEGCDHPETYVKTLRAIDDCQQGNKSGYMMELDATASGLQIMALLSGCTTTAEAVNLLDTGNREDVYQVVADRMSDILGYKLDKAHVKKPVMTHYYNSKRGPATAFNEAELDAFYTVLNGMLPGGELVMDEINKQWNPKAKYHEWTLPDGHVAHVRTMTQKTSSYMLEGTKLKYMYYINRGNTNDYRSLAPNVTHSIDGYIARQMVLRADFEIVHVHDCFLYHPNNHYAVKELYKSILIEIYESFDLNKVIQSISKKKSSIELGKIDVERVENSEYALS